MIAFFNIPPAGKHQNKLFIKDSLNRGTVSTLSVHKLKQSTNLRLRKLLVHKMVGGGRLFEGVGGGLNLGR